MWSNKGIILLDDSHILTWNAVWVLFTVKGRPKVVNFYIFLYMVENAPLSILPHLFYFYIFLQTFFYFLGKHVYNNGKLEYMRNFIFVCFRYKTLVLKNIMFKDFYFFYLYINRKKYEIFNLLLVLYLN